MGMALGNGGDDKHPVPTLNVTPLIDVALVVLIIFMVVTPMLMKQFWLNLPKKEQEEKEPPPTDDANKPLVMTVDPDGTIRVNQTALARGEIRERLPRMIAAKRQKVLYFDAHDDVPYGVAVEAMDLARAGGARSIAMLTEKLAR
ncbi:MAG: biopolymer transporter ExbD [Polyangiaceae bacterium]|nr:biopolymer transporter ExbD [Polyangiaceae bacterium]